MSKSIFTLFLAFLFSATVTNAQLNTTFQSNVTYSPKVNDVWGYAAGGKEFALVGLQNGVNIQDVTDPANPIDRGTASGVSSTWRDIKTYSTYAYVTNESGDGLMVIDLSNIGTTSITSSDYWNWEPNIPALSGDLSTCHNLYIDGAGYAYLAGCNLNNGGIIYVDVFTNPSTPGYVNHGANVYAHDVFVEGDHMYTSEIYAGKFAVYDIADKTNTLLLASNLTPGSFTHNAWTDGSVIYTTDEISNGVTAAYDINDLNNITYLDEFKPLASINTNVIPHNVHLHNGYLVTSHYSDGLVIVDASEPDNLIEVGNYDTYTGAGTGSNGAWGAFPYLPSGNVLISDRTSGLYVVTPTYVRAARLEGIVTDLVTGDPIPNATITIDNAQANLGTSDIIGEYKTGIAAAGTFDVTIEAPGYTSTTLSATIVNGVITILSVNLKSTTVPLELTSFEVAKNENDFGLLTWEAVSSYAGFDFVVEKSVDGVIFNTIAEITQAGEIGVAKQFSYVDENTNRGVNYYRIKMVDQDKSINYSPVKRLTIEGGIADQIEVFPNPFSTSEFLNVHIPKSNNDISIRIFNAQGALLYGQHLSGGMTHQVPAHLLGKGLNFLVIENEAGILKTERVVK